MQKALSLLFVLFISASAISQSPDLIRKNILGNPGSTLYLQTDRDTYFSGDTIWAKGFATGSNENSSAPYSLTAELADMKELKVLSSQTFSITRNAASAIINLPADLPTGTYLIRAYSRGLVEQEGVIFTKLIKVHNLSNKEKEELIYKEELAFYPEGGHFLAAETNRVAFAFTGKSGLPADMSGKILNAAGIFICTFASSHNGMGVFSIKPQAKESYFAVIDSDPNRIRYPLPVAGKGVNLSVQNDSNAISFSISAHFTDPGNQPAFLVVQIGKKKVYEAFLKADSTMNNGTIPVGDFPSGVARLSVFSKDTLLLAERLCFIDNKEYVLPANLTVSLLSKDYRAENLFSLNLDEPVPGTFSVSVTDAGFEEPGAESQNIYASSLLTCYLKNRVYNSGKYFNGGYKNSRALLDLVVLTNSWGGPKWEERKNILATATTGREILSGKIWYRGTRKPFANSSVLLVALSTEDSTTQTLAFLTDSAGRFNTGKVNLVGRNRLLFSSMKKKSDFIDVELDQTRAMTIPFRFPKIIGTQMSAGNQPGTIYDSLAKSWGYLNDVVVQAKRKSRLQLLEGRYAKGRFKELYGEVYDLTEVKNSSGNILDYLRARYPAIQVELDPTGNYKVTARNSSGEFASVPIYLNEVLVWEVTDLFGVIAEDIAIIKVVENLVPGETAIAMYTRKGIDYTAANSNYAIKYYDGFSRPAQFYSPVYQPGQPTTVKTDNRITLLWNPKAATSKRINFIPIHFYNNDSTKVFRVVIEGISEDGKLLYFERSL
ncbi:MAG: hypothetical protein V4722_02620 [Bacteroidota bacterium]